MIEGAGNGPSPEMRGSEILREAEALITGPRQDAYSHPSDDYRRVRDIFEGITGISLSIDQAILFMVAVKLARLGHNLAEGRLHRDSIVDAVGYLGCLSIHLESEGVEGTLRASDDPASSPRTFPRDSLQSFLG